LFLDAFGQHSGALLVEDLDDALRQRREQQRQVDAVSTDDSILARLLSLSQQRARGQVRAQDFEEFDMILAMDRGHLKALQRIAPPHHHAKIRLFVPDFDVPDPYYGGAEGFEKVLDLVEERCHALLDELKLTF